MKIAIPSLLLFLAGCAAPVPAFTHQAPVADGGGGSAPVADGGANPGTGGSAPVADGGSAPTGAGGGGSAPIGTGGAAGQAACLIYSGADVATCEHGSSSDAIETLCADLDGTFIPDGSCPSQELIGCCTNEYGTDMYSCYYTASGDTAAQDEQGCASSLRGTWTTEAP